MEKLKKFLECQKQFWLIDQEKGRLSHTKFWANTGHLLNHSAFVYLTLRFGFQLDLYLLWSAICIGNKTMKDLATTHITSKVGGKVVPEPPSPQQ